MNKEMLFIYVEIAFVFLLTEFIGDWFFSWGYFNYEKRMESFFLTFPVGFFWLLGRWVLFRYVVRKKAVEDELAD